MTTPPKTQSRVYQLTPNVAYLTRGRYAYHRCKCVQKMENGYSGATASGAHIGYGGELWCGSLPHRTTSPCFRERDSFPELVIYTDDFDCHSFLMYQRDIEF